MYFISDKKDEIPNLSSNRYYHLADPGGFLAERDVVGLTQTDRPKNEYNGTEITPYHSSVDKDGDGTDDQTDILKNALVLCEEAAGLQEQILSDRLSG